jgi:hypothetical protein
MTKKFTLALIALIPIVASAQPTLSKAEDITAGTSVKFQNCPAAVPGAAGANKTWDFSNLSPTVGDITRLTYSAAPAGNPFGANLVQKSSDSLYRYINKQAGGSYVAAIIDSSADGDNISVSYATNTMLQIKRPCSYNTVATDTFSDQYSVMGATVTGGGTISLKADGYGTLKLPTGTFNNVLRIRAEHVQNDTFGPPISMSITNTIVSYTWYDNDHVAPLLRIDSTISIGSSDVTTAYLLNETYPLAVTDAMAKTQNATASFTNEGLILRSEFKTDRKYEMNLYNFSGQLMHHSVFIPTSTMQKFPLTTDLIPGLYVVKLKELYTVDNTSVIKLIK